MTYYEIVNLESWKDRLNKRDTFKDWKLHRPQVRKMMTTGSYHMPYQMPEQKVNGNFSSFTEDTQRSVSTDPPQVRRVRKRLLLGLFGLISLVAIVIPIVVVLILKNRGSDSDSDATVSTVNIEVTVKNLQFSEGLADPESLEYRNFTLHFCQEIEEMYQANRQSYIFDGCLVTDIRNGSLIVIFMIAFQSDGTPTENQIRSPFTKKVSEADGKEIKLGPFSIIASSIVIGEITKVDMESNPIPNIRYGDSCKKDQACRTYRAVCVDNKCGCPSTRDYTNQTDSCVLMTTTTSSSTDTTATSLTVMFNTTEILKTLQPTALTDNASSTNISVSSKLSTMITSVLETSSQYSTSSSTAVSMVPSKEQSDTLQSTLIPPVSEPSSTYTLQRESTVGTSSKIITSTESTEHATPQSGSSMLSQTSSATKTATTSTTKFSSESTFSSISSMQTSTASPSFTISVSLNIFPSTEPTVSRSPAIPSSETSTGGSKESTATTSLDQPISSSSSDVTETIPTTVKVAPISSTRLEPFTSRPAIISSTSDTSYTSTTMRLSSEASKQETEMSTTPQTTKQTTLPVLEDLPEVTLHVPSTKILRIGKVERIICQVDNASSWTIIYLSRTTADGTHSIGSVNIKKGSWDTSYGPDSPQHIGIYAEGFDLHASVNITLTLDAVQCDDAARYRCSVDVPGYSHNLVYASEDLTVFRQPSVQLKFPNKLLEGLWGPDIGCVASLGYPEGKLTFMRKLPDEKSFTPFVPKNTSNLRQEVTENMIYPCIKEVLYEFDSSLKGWDQAQVLCAINEGSDDEITSDTGVIQIVPRVVCDGIEAGNNVPHPFDCKMYINCTGDEISWGNVRLSNCADGECWLQDGECGTTTTGPTSTGQITTMGTTIQSDGSGINCMPRRRSATVGESFTYKCMLNSIEKVTQIKITQLAFEITDQKGLNGTFIVDFVRVMIGLNADDQIVVSVEHANCSLEGDITVVVNGNLSDTVILRIIGDPTTPNLSMPEFIYRNQETIITCSGNVGRLEDGSDAAYLNFEIKQEGEDNATRLTQGVEKLKTSSQDCENQVNLQLKIYASEVLNHAVIHCIITDKATQTKLSMDISEPLTILSANIYFDKELKYDAVIGETLSFTCSFRSIQGVDQLMITRGDPKQEVVVAYKNGTTSSALTHFSVATFNWATDSGNVTIDVQVICGDEEIYTCEAEGFKAATFISVSKMPGKPILTLSHELIEGQESFSECKADLGKPAGDLVIEAFTDGIFYKLNFTLAEGYPVDIQSDCGTERTIQFYFRDLNGLNNTRIRCAVKSETFFDEELFVSDKQIIQVVDSSYCDGINSSFYVHPYDCHYFVDCNLHGSGNLHFTRCSDPPNSCPDPLGGCNPGSCDTVCWRGSATTISPMMTSTTRSATQYMDMYLKCNTTKEPQLHTEVIIECELRNTDISDIHTVTVYHEGNKIFEETGTNGTITSDDDLFVLTYSHQQISLGIPQLQCINEGLYTIIVNAACSDNVTLIVETNPEVPTLKTTRFIAGQLTTVTCQGSLGKPQGYKELYLEAAVMGNEFQPTPTSFEETQFSHKTCSYVKTVAFSLEVVIDRTAMFRCRISDGSKNYTSQYTSSTVEPQEVFISPQDPTMTIGHPFSIECIVSTVTDLTSIKLYRSDPPQPICQVIKTDITENTTDILCSGETTTTNGSLQIEFLSVQCSDEGDYICECNREASTPKRSRLYVTRPPIYPRFTALPTTIIENKQMLQNESITCESELGHPAAGSLVLQTNKGVSFETYDLFGANWTRIEKECNRMETLSVKTFTFDISWNNTQLRCVIVDEDGNATNYLSEEFTIWLMPDDFCQKLILMKITNTYLREVSFTCHSRYDIRRRYIVHALSCPPHTV